MRKLEPVLVAVAVLAIVALLTGIVSFLIHVAPRPTCQDSVEANRGWCVRECATNTMKPLTQCRAECSDMYWCKEGEQ